ncbi:MAG: lipocalin family protein [Saprospiraceae bacterium]
MKISKWIFPLLFISIFLASCSDDDSSNADNSDLVGTWNMTSVDYNAVSSTTAAGFTTTATSVGTSFDENSTLTITNDNMAATGTYGLNLVVTTEFSGNTTSANQTWESQQFTNNGAYTRSGNTLTVENPQGGTDDMNIDELTANNLTLSGTVVTTTSQSGATGTSTIDVVFYFER